METDAVDGESFGDRGRKCLILGINVVVNGVLDGFVSTKCGHLGGTPKQLSPQQKASLKRTVNGDGSGQPAQ